MSWRYAAHAANENFPSDAVSELEAAGHDIVWVRNAAPGSKDEDHIGMGEVAAAGAPLFVITICKPPRSSVGRNQAREFEMLPRALGPANRIR